MSFFRGKKKAHLQKIISERHVISTNILAGCTLNLRLLYLWLLTECHFGLEVSFYVCIPILSLRCFFLSSFRTFSVELPGRFLGRFAWSKVFKHDSQNCWLRTVGIPPEEEIKPSIHPCQPSPRPVQSPEHETLTPAFSPGGKYPFRILIHFPPMPQLFFCIIFSSRNMFLGHSVSIFTSTLVPSMIIIFGKCMNSSEWTQNGNSNL